jgi:Lar family restriction alleviation protein
MLRNILQSNGSIVQLNQERSPAMTKQLKPCPFCGSADVSIIDTSDWDGNASTVACGKCAAGVREIGRSNSRIKAITAWNTRAAPAPVVEVTDKMVERACVELAEGDWALYGEEWQEVTRRVMRAALVAAFGGQL